MKIIIGMAIAIVGFLYGIQINESLIGIGSIFIGVAIALTYTQIAIGATIGIAGLLYGIHINNALSCIGGMAIGSVIAAFPIKR